jgi:RimJ/RimL family protein N-acetyltransferase
VPESIGEKARRFGTAPRIETERLVLRAHQKEDFLECAAMWREPEVVRYTIGNEAPPQRTWQRLLAYCGHWQLQGFGYWAIEERSSGRFIGELGFADFQRDCTPSIEGIPEVGWALSAAEHGRGYATEALRQVIAWGDECLGAVRTVCIIHRDNSASLRLADKFGYRTQLRPATDEEPHMLLARDLGAQSP